jgi:hypothetical protein
MASPEEAATFEEMCRLYPELAAARNEFELQLENHAFEQSVTPDPAVRESLLAKIAAEYVSASPVVPMNIHKPVRKFSWLAAASVIALIALSALAVTFYQKNKKLERSTVALRAELDSTRMQMEELARQQSMISNPNTADVSLVSTETIAKPAANVYWDSTSTDVYLVVRNLPELPSEKQYQLWALINKQPVDLGLFDAGSRIILKMKNTQKADAFAITIEKRGNTGGPKGTLSASGKML